MAIARSRRPRRNPSYAREAARRSRRRQRAPYRGYPQGISGAAAESRRTGKQITNTGTTFVDKMASAPAPLAPASQTIKAPQVAPAALPEIQPFLTGGDMLNEAEGRLRYESGLQDIDHALEDLRIQTEYGIKQIDKQEVAAEADAEWNTGARGLGRSSIRDGALWDIDATAALQRNFLNTQLNTAVLQGQQKKETLGIWWTDFRAALDRLAVENAAAIPTPEPPAPAPAPDPAPTPAKEIANTSTANNAPVYGQPVGSGKPGGTGWKPMGMSH